MAFTGADYVFDLTLFLQQRGFTRFINELKVILLPGTIPALNRGTETRTTKDISQYARLRAEDRPRISR
jgi:hypothetical protein